jgi:S1-C subfamily serine protease
MGIRLAGDKHGLFICEVQPNSVAQKAGLLVADKIFSVSISMKMMIIDNMT